MSSWADLEAEFWPTSNKELLTVESVTEDVPQGSEGGSLVRSTGDRIYVHGRLRDMDDYDSPSVLAWFLQNARWSSKATLYYDVDFGPKYRFEYDENGLRKLKGILDL